MLDLFESHRVHATWAIVGLLFFDNRDELLANLPTPWPNYRQATLSSYSRLLEIGPNESSDPLHYGLSLIKRIKSLPTQEIASHTFSHYYCLEEGQDETTFRADLVAAKNAASRIGVEMRSLVFPRNQVRRSYLPVCRQAGFDVFRGTANFWAYRSRKRTDEKPWTRAARLADSCMPLSGHQTYAQATQIDDLVDVPASLLLRPVSVRPGYLDRLRLSRILKAMHYAAKSGRVFHLWWHPENFGTHVRENLELLAAILENFRLLKDQYGMTSSTMGEVATSMRSPKSAAA